ncbi:hypothetical protein J2X69_003640 [Algoriphagus sp. 4150]|uniref:hypothetical protein n=1 Tax=Algoriphagus sp. 4150 TaxID=2817756 RepID=UPI00285B8839|nr:hypothetical protein [Algoriphagus sp. 4150]MDR7131279.1 hypothetical protein [Algoriphagus sp. 4150]
MTEFFKEFFQTVNERLRNKIFGPFLISFLAWNWEPILMIIASNKTIELTISTIKDEGLFDIENVLLIPLAISLVYSVLAGYITNGIDWLNMRSLKWKIGHKYINKDFEITQKLTVGKKEYEYQEMISGNATLADLNSKIQTLTENQKKLVNENMELRGQSAKNIELSRELSELKISSKDLEGNYEMETIKYDNLKEDFIFSGLELINYQLQNGNFQLIGVPERLIQSLINLKVIHTEKVNEMTVINFTEKGIVNYLRSKNEE